MENFKVFPCANAIFASLVMFAAICVNGQISTPCTASMLSNFTPCLNFITGSTANGGSPTSACCDSLRSLTSVSMDCACLIVTGNVPFSLPVNRQLAISLPRACKSGGVPVQCKASGVPLPAPGPALFGPTPPPSAANSPSPKGSKGLAPASDEPDGSTSGDITPPEASPPPASPADDPTAFPGSRPVLNPTSSASTPSYTSSPFLLLAFVAILFMIIFN